ncbi:N-acetylglucosamine-6-phosphate deacetylase [Actinoplanes sp. SE50]|uniref:N-acetylglucosamine-6-phosphate deacetylase n=1 Tax=unclassified Actinoplanes TaxID=2626549 RepID=UPI00023EDF7B|nr:MULTISPECIES: N-acetylglucosamine-6-phosphate deacetylase [unclassified Actinoplanes]AEV88877.1 N-acetylglucosamine-6-phosphate deacetylase [Actinoplanes sp. SE50/110]ATO87283.1 N-acetylglucosamine-6-phosphate deacetylase [Actinoplanes sp. SE50]SLM04701.1 N-acetylglucosamine-6-phosphate deacetylase [Actinoplanes sp. SE50/110]
MTRISGRIVTPGGVVTGHLDIEDATIAAIVADDTAGDDVIVPGFIDLHCHGGGGHTFTTGDPAAARAAAAFHLGHGTTTMLASLVSSPFELMREATLAYRPLVDDGVIAGIHFEGPYLSSARCGAQNPAFLRDPVLAEIEELVTIGAGGVRMMTVAPELDGALAAIACLREAGVLAAIGHTDASYEQTLAGVAAGASVATHLFNGMRPVHHREPGPVVGLLSSTATVELIGDGIHLHPGMLAFAATSAPGRSILVTDAMAATGMPDGEYDLGGQAVVVADRVARLARDGAIAGSTLTMDVAVRNAVAAGLPLETAVAMSSTTPARLLGLADRGALAVGLRADVVVLDADLAPRRVLRAGVGVFPQ